MQGPWECACGGGVSAARRVCTSAACMCGLVGWLVRGRRGWGTFKFAGLAARAVSCAFGGLVAGAAPRSALTRSAAEGRAVMPIGLASGLVAAEGTRAEAFTCGEQPS